MIFWLKNRQPDKWRDRVEADMNVSIVSNEEMLLRYDERMRQARERQAAVLVERGLSLPGADEE